MSHSPSTWRRARAAARQHPGDKYAAFREALRVLIPYVWRRRAVHFARNRFGLRALGDWLRARWAPAPPATADRVERSSTSSPGDFYESLTLLPHLPPAEVEAILKQPLSPTASRQPDIICFSIIDWSFRFQRPQQLMLQFAAHGHRVFHLNISEFLSIHARPKFSARTIHHSDGTEIHEVRVAARYPLDLFGAGVSEKEAREVLASLDDLRRGYDINEAIAYVMFPSWGGAALGARRRWGWRVVYDCMDEWENFPRVGPPSLALEKELARECDLLVVTARRLWEKWQSYNRPMLLARNATDYAFYAERCQPNELLPGLRHPLIGYYGAIADWFDVELLAETARLRPDYAFVLLGGVFDVDVSPLQALPNVKLLGQQPYETMPQYLYHFDACIIPFKLNPITEATDPVKLYEYLSGGKPVVSVRLPELEPYRDLVYLAGTAAEFAAQLDRAIAEDSPQRADERKAGAREHTWERRYEAIAEGIRAITPRASIIIVTYNNLALTKLCLESVLRNTEYPNYEIIVVDNRSKDGTPGYLESMAAAHDNLSVILNTENHGFAKANNQGIARSTGEYLVLLNNDTIAPPGWLSRLLAHLRDPRIGLVGPMTNFVGNEARLEVDYQTWQEMEAFARHHVRSNHDRIAEIHMLAMFCVAMRREVFDRIGPLDERFGIGMFEDDDYSMRVKAAGLRVVCAADALVHHFGQAAFGKLIESGQYNPLFDRNRRLYEAKWGAWVPHVNAKLDFKPHLGRVKK
jgi:GT2 family glycosyltransferase/glycosyltransferase involved in cell wall biosynthesis